ncbi:hypothetical protein LTR10_022793 [Elasticomyces elasticus]|uniref:BTB domain-containing protein n=1 Tax=Exophiala sideris TaxID=1016849 RepID=A0ABR0JMR0_9EURO|nr:hypothetical protein LTR10_022793 [Elasticomyces elasticus]KAK5036579.1 hypothetical protein LTS07_002306 [Exophiala sideris]KAK5041591.1 hypothetical protein LTR13_002258 [Exophiala sideris]KAK5066962.1 hypothetical protein LTR69_002310 [Exophiala sideris]KAK5185021.1 hypothetical protein LTR44_002867 [Eurotiomycetes sp. CCFEE 6388]
MESPPTSAFPKFVDGDVLIIISTTQYYKLHSQVLQAHSPMFAQEMKNNPGPRLNAQARRENAAAYRFELAREPGNLESPGQFLRIDVNENGRSPQSTLRVGLPDLSSGKPTNIINQAWEWLFGVFYNREPTFDDSGLAPVLACVMALIEVSESIGASEHVCDIVDLALMRQDTVLWSAVMGDPNVWIELGRRIRSPAIYREAAIHLVGQWDVLPEEKKSRIGADIREILSRKSEELALAKEAIELRILGHYPQFMTRNASSKPGRPTYSADIYMWMCVSFFRQWFAQSISDDRTRRAPDGGLNFYAALYEGGQAYLTHMDFKTFHQFFPMSIKACHVLEANMGVLKEDIKQFVADLMTERTHLKRAEHEIGWLTCAKIEKEDLPWANEVRVGHAPDGLEQVYQSLQAQQAMEQEQTPPRPKKRARMFVEEDEDEDDDEGMFVRQGDADAMEEDDE